MNYKKSNSIILICICLSVFVIGLSNYIIDPFELFHSHFLKIPDEMNERFNKVLHLKKTHQDYNGYLLGSSRIGTTSPSIFERYLKDSHFYNLTIAGGTQLDNLCLVKYLISQHYPVKYL